MEEAFAVSRDAGNPPVRFDVAGAGDGVMEPLNGHEAGNSGHRQGASCTPPRRSPKRLHQLRPRHHFLRTTLVGVFRRTAIAKEWRQQTRARSPSTRALHVLPREASSGIVNTLAKI